VGDLALGILTLVDFVDLVDCGCFDVRNFKLGIIGGWVF
jgi:hypothetical protein